MNKVDPEADYTDEDYLKDREMQKELIEDILGYVSYRVAEIISESLILKGWTKEKEQ